MYQPMLCRLGTESELLKLSHNPEWLFEPKLDGIRLLAETQGTQRRLWGRSGLQKTQLFPELHIETLKDVAVVLDGEVISGATFNGIQHRASLRGVAQAAREYPAKYWVFDILELAGTSLRNVPLRRRREILSQVLKETDNVSIVSSTPDGAGLFEVMKGQKLEGVVGKSLSGLYQDNRRVWLKVKCWQQGVFTVVGYTQGQGWRSASFGSLVLAARGTYVGQVGTGFKDEDIAALRKFMTQGTVPDYARSVGEPVTWVQPFPAKIKFLEYSNSGLLRFPVFQGVV